MSLTFVHGTEHLPQCQTFPLNWVAAPPFEAGELRVCRQRKAGRHMASALCVVERLTRQQAWWGMKDSEEPCALQFKWGFCYFQHGPSQVFIGINKKLCMSYLMICRNCPIAVDCAFILSDLKRHVTFVPVMSLLFFTQSFPLIAVIMWLFRQEVLSYSTHSPVKTDKSVEDVLGNLNLSSTITPQMINLGLSQERKSSSVWWDAAEWHKTAQCFQMLFHTTCP